MTFKDFLSRRQPRFDAKGDFVRLAMLDPDMPDVASGRELDAHLQVRGFSFDATEAGRAIWLEYLAANGKHRAAPSC